MLPLAFEGADTARQVVKDPELDLHHAEANATRQNRLAMDYTVDVKLRPKPKSSQAAPHHLASLDGLRGMAVLGVMASHLFPGNYVAGSVLTRAVGSIFSFGAKGVDLFFVLSGFLITGILYDSLADTAYFRRFYARRALRIFPLYYGVILGLLALTPWLGIVWHGVQWTLLFYLQNTSLATPIWDFGLPHGLNLVHFWSLAVEEQFYLVWPLAVFLIHDRKRLLGWCLAISVVSLAWRLILEFHGAAYHFINCGTLCRADALLIGAGLAMLVRGEEKETVLAWGQKLLVGATAVLGAIAAIEDLYVRHSHWAGIYGQTRLAVSYTIYALGAAGLVASCLVPGSIAARIFENRSLRWFGRYSYGLYVIHMLILWLLLEVFRGWFRQLTSNKPLIDLAAGCLLLGVSVLLAYTSYHLYEKPFLKLKRYFAYDRPERIPVGAPINAEAALQKASEITL